MPKLVTKFKYLHPSYRRKAGGYATYIATREGVQKIHDKTYADYIATRPRAHGLFSDDGETIKLSRISRELNQYRGRMWTGVISLRREDAARLGIDNALRWRDFLRAHVDTLAENFKITMEHLKWYGAFHDEGHHPHVHLIIYSTDPREGYLTRKGIERIRSVFASDIFAQDLLEIYQRQTEHRDALRQEGHDRAAQLVAEVQTGRCENTRVQSLLLQLAEQLSETGGRRAYGFLPPEVKRTVDAIVDELAAYDRLSELYDLWWEEREHVLRTYTDEMPERPPLSQVPEFRSIKNDVIQEAMALRVVTQLIPSDEWSLAATGAVRLMYGLSCTIRDDLVQVDPDETDRKLRQQIQEKKHALGLR